MPDWLIEGDRSVAMLLGIVALAAAAWGWKTEQRRWLIVAGVALTLLVGFLLADRFWESDRERIGSTVQAMAGAIGPRSFDVAASHLSEKFYYGTLKKSDFRRLADATSKTHRVRDVVVWNYQLLSLDEARSRAEVSFQFKVHVDGGAAYSEAFYRCKATFIKEADGQWRMLTFLVYPLTGADQPLTIPGVG